MALRTVSLICCLLPLAAQEPKLHFPGREWEKVKPESEGHSSAKLEALRGWLKTQQTTALHVSVRGRTIFEYGDPALPTKVASVRKSVLAMLYGNYVEQGKIDLTKTVEQLGLTDVQPFLPIEKTATLLNLLTARSGVYLPTANQELGDISPRRGSQWPGTYFQYQNWDFNAAGTAFATLSGKSVFKALEEDLARPIGMQDFDPKIQRLNDEMPVTRHPEYAMYLSTRDTARLGLLMLADGNWNGKRVMPKGWAGRITTLITHSEEIHPMLLGAFKTHPGRWGYGMLWWVWDAPIWPGVVSGPYQGAYSAIGANGQYITVIPAMDLVFAHKVDIDHGPRQISAGEFHAILQLVMESGCGDKCK